MQYSRHQILEIVNTQLLFWIKKDEHVKEAVLELVETRYSTKKETDSKFDKVLKELANDREAQEKRWDEWKIEDKKKWDEWKIEDKKKWEAQEKKWEAQEKKWEAQEKKWETQEKKWNENQIVIEKLLQNIDEFNKKSNDFQERFKKFEVTLSAIGTRWGVGAESSFRDGLKSILETDFHVKVVNYNKMDNDRIVYKRPQPVEIDIIIHNGKIILCEISASFSSDEVDTFVKKIEFYEKKEKVKVSRSIIISPMLTPQAIEEAKYYGIEVFSCPEKKMF